MRYTNPIRLVRPYCENIAGIILLTQNLAQHPLSPDLFFRFQEDIVFEPPEQCTLYSLFFRVLAWSLIEGCILKTIEKYPKPGYNGNFIANNHLIQKDSSME